MLLQTPEQALTPSNAVDLAMDLLLSSQAWKHSGESVYKQFETTNPRQRHSHQYKS